MEDVESERKTLFSPYKRGLKTLLTYMQGEKNGFLQNNFVEKKGRKVQLKILKNNVFLYVGERKKRNPDMGVSFKAILEQVSDFSTFQAVYPQYLVSYPQDYGTDNVIFLVQYPHMWAN